MLGVKSVICKAAFQEISSTDAIRIQHPNLTIFNILEIVEQTFSKYCENRNCFDLSLSDLQQNSTLKVPCSEHAKGVIPVIVYQYLHLKMRQFLKEHMSEVQKENLVKKKAAKLAKP